VSQADDRTDAWGRISSHLDAALDDARRLIAQRPAPHTRSVHNLLALLEDARREVDARELEARVLATRTQRLVSELEALRQRTDALMRIGQAINAVREIPALLQLIVDLAVGAAKAERGLIVVRDPDGRWPEMTATAHMDDGALDPPAGILTRSVIERAFREGRAVATTDAAGDDADRAPAVHPLHIRSLCCVPIRSQDTVIGALYADARITADGRQGPDADLLAAIADQAAVAIDNARLYEDLRHSLHELSSLKSQNDEVLESIASGVIVFDDRDVVVQFNHAAELTFGLSASTIVGRSARLLDTWLPGFTSLLHRHKANPDRHMEVEIGGNHFVRGPVWLQVTFFRVRGAASGTDSTAAVINDLTESRAREAEKQAQAEKAERVARSFERYLAPHVVDSLLKDPGQIVLGGTRQTATMLFADIRGFTELSATLEPEQVVELLNRYLAPVVNVIFANAGLLDKFYGDGVMAVFGAPRPAEDDAWRAVVAARQILEQVRLLNDNDRAHAPRPLVVSIGLATGDVVAGHIGSERRMEYTVIGDAVNLASRLQQLAQPNEILADAQTYERVKERVAATRRLARVKGKPGLTPVYALPG
jgi:adenylate cyclase